MKSALKGFHYGHTEHNQLRQLIASTIVIGVIAPVLTAVSLSQKLSPSPTETKNFQLW
ncbi:hypothetical protein SynROS8604_02452 [Synechococcus sp. ROS8604]|nr:hypothetical protein SynROS8604_02452 [Synechococcus sp. ROS8604]